MASNAATPLLGALTALGIATLPACQAASSPDEGELSLDATRHVGEIRAAFRIASPVAGGTRAPVIGESIATGYERAGSGLHPTSLAASEVDLELPASADGARHLTNRGVAISARLRAAPSSAEIADGYVVYREALGDRASVIEQVRADGVEDFFYFPTRPVSEHIVFDVDLEAGVGGLRLVANTLEILDVAGIPRLRVNPPIAIGADGAVVAAQLGVEKCAVDTSPAIPSRIRTPAGTRSCELHLSWQGVTYPALVDPSWVATGSMAYARVFPASSLVIDNHHVLVSGGYDLTTGALTTAEVWDASTGVWTVTGSMTDKRYAHQQAILGTGKVLVTGGLDYASPYVASSEEYDPVSGTWINRTTMAAGRYDFPLVMVSGAPVVVGGWSASGPLAACEKYDPVAHTWSAFPSMATPRGGAAAASSGPNAFIVSGGYNYTSGYLDSSELYSTAAGTFWAGAPMVHKRAYHLANPVTGNPRVLVTGGADSTGYLKTAEVYYGSFVFPQPGSWSAIADMSIARMRHQTVNLAPNRVMACGGLQASSVRTSTCETFDSWTFGWSTDCTMVAARDEFTMLVVPSLSKALAAGGYVLSSAELSCHHDRCTSGIPLVGTSSACISSICSADPFCCSTAWDSVCIAEVRTVCSSLTCPESEGSCTHPLCTPGAALVSGCDSGTAGCAASICTADPYCCMTAWDSICVGEVASVCGKNCN